MKTKIHTDHAPLPAGHYSQAIKTDHAIYLAGQIPIDPKTKELISKDFKLQAEQVFKNLAAVCQAAGCSLNDIVRLTVYLTNLADFAVMNDVMQSFFTEPYPARTTFQVAALPKEAKIEVDGIIG